MERGKRRQLDMFEDFSNLSLFVKRLGGIVQNNGVNINDNELLDWSDEVNKAINKLSMLREDVLRYYQD